MVSQLLVKSDLFISCEGPDGHRYGHGCAVFVCVFMFVAMQMCLLNCMKVHTKEDVR